VIALSAAWLVSQPVRAMEGPAAGTDGAVDPALPPPPPPGGPLMRILDTDDSRDLSAEEIAAAPEVLQSLDKNGDGKLTKDELPEFAAERLMRADTNGDGAVSKEELTEMRQKFAERPGAGPAGPGAGGRGDPAEMFQRLDKNGDGSLTKDELPERMAQWLMRADADGNGSLSKEELQKAREQVRGRPDAPRQ